MQGKLDVDSFLKVLLESVHQRDEEIELNQFLQGVQKLLVSIISMTDLNDLLKELGFEV